MYEKICNTEYRIILVLSYVHCHNVTICLCNNTVYGKWECYPLILLDSAVIVSVEICKSALLIQRILLHIHSRGINVCTEYVHALLKLLLSYIEHGDRLVHPHGIHFISSCKALLVLNDLLQISVAVILCLSDDLFNAFSLCLAIVKEFPVVLTQALQLLYLILLVFVPRIFLCHFHCLLLITVHISVYIPRTPAHSNTAQDNEYSSHYYKENNIYCI